MRLLDPLASVAINESIFSLFKVGDRKRERERKERSIRLMTADLTGRWRKTRPNKVVVGGATPEAAAATALFFAPATALIN